jgi:hypothetical protein
MSEEMDFAQLVAQEDEIKLLMARCAELEADRENLLQLLDSASEIIDRFVSDESWAQSDMDMMDNIDTVISRMRRAAQ